MFKAIFKLIILVVEKLSSELAILAAIISTSHTGDIPRKILSGVFSIYVFIYEFADAYLSDAVFSESYKKFADAFNAAVESAGKNIMENPRGVLLGFVATFFAYKVLAVILRMMRKKLLRRYSKDIHSEKNNHDKCGETYNKLYNDQ